MLRSGHYEAYVLDVVRDVQRRFAARRDRRDRAIAGFSAGAYGAINIALHNLAVFGSVQVWSGYFTQTRSAVFAHAMRAQLAYNSPIDYVRTVRGELRHDPLRVFMFVDGATNRAVRSRRWRVR
jgi:S-formylglutathione hydrolase FrmB